MKGTKRLVLMHVALLFLFVACAVPVLQTTTTDDFQNGLTAYNKGDYATALKIFRPLAELGDLRAQYYLGGMYGFGQGVSQDFILSAKWYIRAYEQGNSDAPYRLGRMYDLGTGVSQNFKLAVKWYTRATEYGNIDAPFRLGLMFALGRGVQQDFERAYAWLDVAVSTGDEEAAINRDSLIRKMSPDQVTQAYRLSRELYEKFYAGQ